MSFASLFGNSLYSWSVWIFFSSDATKAFASRVAFFLISFSLSHLAISDAVPLQAAQNDHASDLDLT